MLVTVVELEEAYGDVLEIWKTTHSRNWSEAHPEEQQTPLSISTLPIKSERTDTEIREQVSDPKLRKSTLRPT